MYCISIICQINKKLKQIPRNPQLLNNLINVKMLKLETFTENIYIIMYLHKVKYSILLYTYVVTNKDVLILLNGKYIFFTTRVKQCKAQI
jgi:hypothetical protein